MNKRRLKKVINFILLIGVITTSVNAFAYKAIGWHWYNELLFVKEKKERQKQEQVQQEQQKRQKQQKPKELKERNEQENIAQNEQEKEQEKSSTTAVAEMKHLRETVEEVKARAILVPTETNVRDYIALQNYVAAKATVFSQVWQKVLLDYPDLDLRAVSPTQSAIQSVVYEEKGRKEMEAIEYFRTRYGLLFFYRGSNPLDIELAQVVNTFVQENNISFIPVSVDGKVLEIFVDSKVNNGQAEKLGIRHFPALILVDPSGKKIKPINYGFISGAELRERFLQVATNFNVNDGM